MKEQATQAFVIMVDDRYYYHHTKQRISTAWSLAGAKLFLIKGSEDKMQKAEKVLQAKGYSTSRKIVKLCYNFEL
jgi:hypothetical protein